MKRTIIQLGTLALACAFSTMAFAQRVDVKPRGAERVNELMQPGAMDSAVTTKAPKGMTMDAANDNKKPATNAANDNDIECKMGQLSPQVVFNIVKGSAPDITFRQVNDLISGGYLKRGTCQKALDTLKAEPLANAIRLAQATKDCLSGQNPVGHPKTDQCEVEANMKVFGMDKPTAEENKKGLEECAYLPRAA